VFLIVGLAFCAAFAYLFVQRSSASLRQQARLEAQIPRQERTNDTTYVSSHRCQACHADAHATWHQSFHRTMTQVASPESVIGDFDGSTIVSDGLEYRVYQQDGEYWVEMPNPDQIMYVVEQGKRIDQLNYLVRRRKEGPPDRVDLRTIPRVQRQVVMTTGSHHYQTYWVRGDEQFGNLLQTVPLVYLKDDQRWIPREDAFMYPPHSTRLVTQWNHHCIRCHSTGGSPGLDASTGGFRTEVAELGIACEACHGPGDEHIRANRDPLRRYRLHLSGEPDPTVVNPARLDHEASSQVCGQCHGVFVMREEYGMKYAYEGELYKPGEDLFRTRYYIQHPRKDASPLRQRELQLNQEFFRERWWPDGSILAGGREFTAMSASACYTRGEISCLSCHTMHGGDPVDQLRPEMQGNASCTQCHVEPRFTSDIAAHTHHTAGSSGSDCMNCHMPHTAYALLGALRSHDISIPNLKATANDGVPIACNLCHLDQTLAWTQEHLATWYGADEVYLTTEQKEISAALLWLLKGDAAQRIITAWHFGWDPAQQISGTAWMSPFVAQLLTDPYGVVRYVAHEALRKLPGGVPENYDFTAAATEQETVRDAVLSAWRSVQGGVEFENPARLLLSADGDLNVDAMLRLLRQRDERPVTIQE
jgi:predicted CXXCH cytochrome family protein